MLKYAIFLDTKSYFRNYYKDYLHKYGNIWHFMAIIKELPYIYLIINQIFTTIYGNVAILFQKTFSCEAKITEDLTILITIQLATQPQG